MSRTYKDIKKAKSKNDWEYWWDYYCDWMSHEPRWWRRMMKHVPQRRRTKQSLNAFLHGKVSADELLTPLDKKPWIYYW